MAARDYHGAPRDPGEGRRPVLRAVLLGASNLTRGLGSLLVRLRAGADGPIEVLAACGHGRSYGATSRYLFVRRLPGIVASGLWRDLAGRAPLPTVAVVTDPGNDLAYGESPAKVAAWIGTCLARLADQGASTALTLLPRRRLEALPEWRFRLARTLLFPGRPIERRPLLAAAEELDRRLAETGAAAGAHVVALPADWYGGDAIHLRRDRLGAAWDELLTAVWPGGGLAAADAADATASWAVAERRGLPGLDAHRVRLGGLALATPQPARRFNDGSTLSIY